MFRIIVNKFAEKATKNVLDTCQRIGEGSSAKNEEGLSGEKSSNRQGAEHSIFKHALSRKTQYTVDSRLIFARERKRKTIEGERENKSEKGQQWVDAWINYTTLYWRGIGELVNVDRMYQWQNNGNPLVTNNNWLNCWLLRLSRGIRVCLV